MHETVTWLVIVAYAALAAGLPLPAGAIVASPRHVAAAAKAGLLAAKDRSRPFPCMDSPCGCATAEQCFRECCCHSVAERLQWARRHGLEAALLAVLERRVGDGSPPTEAPAGGDCCSSRAAAGKPACRAGSAPSVSCCETGSADDGTQVVARPGEESPAPREMPRRRAVTLRASLACQGLVAEWVSVGGTPPPVVTVAGTLPAPSGTVELLDAVALSPPRVPESPPPEGT